MANMMSGAIEEMGVPNTPNAKPQPFKQGSGTPTATAPRPGVPLPGANRQSSGKIQLANTLENVEASMMLTVGTWPAFIESVEEITASTGSQGIQFNLRFVNFPGVAAKNPNVDRTGRHTVYVTPKALWKVKNTFVAVGQGNAISEFDGDEATRVLVMVDVTEETYTPNPTDQNPNPQPRKSTKCDTLLPWPDDFGGPGTKLPA